MRRVTVTTEGRAALQNRSVRLINVRRERRTTQPSRYPVRISLAETPTSTFLRLTIPNCCPPGFHPDVPHCPLGFLVVLQELEGETHTV